MSSKKTVNITCPRCNYIQDVDLYESINANKDFELKEALMRNKINRINCDNCDFNFRVDLPFLYFDSKNQICIHWVPEIKDISHEQILEEFDQVINQLDTRDTEVLRIRLVRTRVELVELIFLIEKKMNDRLIEFIKYEIFINNPKKLNPLKNRLLLNIENSTDEELLFVIQDMQTNELGEILRYNRSTYTSLSDLYLEDSEEFKQMFPGPCINARYLLLEESN